MNHVALLGPTASGKSAVAMAVALQTPGVELVSVDAMQVYRHLDIGTAKPTIAERAAVPHHGIDLVDPDQEFSVAEFQRAVRLAIADITGRGATPLLVGGTGLYLRAVVDDLQLPGHWPALRAELEQQAAVDLPALFCRLEQLDPAASQKMEPTNDRRIVRALEVCLGSGRPFSSFGPGLDAYPPSSFVQLALSWPRPVIAQRIARRVEVMLATGFLDEVRALERDWELSRTARQALGYRELLDHLAGRLTLVEAVETIVRRTRQFAVRQERWFRRDPRLVWVPLDDDPVADALPAVLEALRS